MSCIWKPFSESLLINATVLLLLKKAHLLSVWLQEEGVSKSKWQQKWRSPLSLQGVGTLVGRPCISERDHFISHGIRQKCSGVKNTFSVLLRWQVLVRTVEQFISLSLSFNYVCCGLFLMKYFEGGQTLNVGHLGSCHLCCALFWDASLISAWCKMHLQHQQLSILSCGTRGCERTRHMHFCF